MIPPNLTYICNDPSLSTRLPYLDAIKTSSLHDCRHLSSQQLLEDNKICKLSENDFKASYHDHLSEQFWMFIRIPWNFVGCFAMSQDSHQHDWIPFLKSLRLHKSELGLVIEHCLILSPYVEAWVKKYEKVIMLIFWLY